MELRNGIKKGQRKEKAKIRKEKEYFKELF